MEPSLTPATRRAGFGARLGLSLLLAGLAVPAPDLGGQGADEYTVLTPTTRRTLPFRNAGGADLVSLDQLANLFGFTYREDSVVNGLTIDARGQAILLIPGLSGANVGGQLRSLSASVQRDGGIWQVPVDFLSRALGPALGTAIEVRRPSHLILVGDVRVPRVQARFERTGAGGRLVVDVTPATPHQITREGPALTVQFEADALEVPGPIAGATGEFVSPTMRAEGVSLVIELGSSTSDVQPSAESTDARVTIDLRSFGLPAVTPAVPPVSAESPGSVDSPIIALTPYGAVQTIVIDAGHGGADSGVTGARGTREKDVTLAAAQQLRALIESRLGLRVLLTRNADDTIPLDSRSAFANNNKADLFISLHADGGPLASVTGARVFSLSLGHYEGRVPARPATGSRIPVWDGSTRLVDITPWEVAQIPFAGRSAALAGILVNHLGASGVPLRSGGPRTLPFRVLVGANMPAILVEMGFLTNPDEERAFASGSRTSAVVAAVFSTITEVRQGVPDSEAAAPVTRDGRP